METLPITSNATYREYKEDTHQIAGWLAKYAVQAGYKAQSTAANAKPSTRLKGKARKEAKAEQAKAAASPAAGPQYAISVSDFTRMAKAISEAKPAVLIPKALDNLFSRAINARKEFASWFNSHSNDDASNKRHSHFLNVLTSAWGILRPSEKDRTSHVKSVDPKASKSEQGPLLDFVNRFAGLHVEGSLDDDTEPEPRSSEQADDYKLADVAAVIIEKSQEDIEDDFLFAIFGFMSEVDEIRRSVRRNWAAYRLGMTELMLCSLITNTSIQLVRRAEHELDLTIERPQKYPASKYPASTFPLIFMYTTHEETMQDDLDTFLRPSFKVASFSCSHADLCLWDIFTVLKHSLHELDANGKGKYFLPVNREYRAMEGEPAETFDTFNRIKRIFPCFQGVSMNTSRSFAGDEITGGFETMFQTKTVPIWVAFGVRLLLDIQDELQTVSEKPLREVKQHARNLLACHRKRKSDKDPYVAADLTGTTWLNPVLEAYELDILGDNFRRVLIRGGRKDWRTGGAVPMNLEELSNDVNAPDCLRVADYFLRINPVKCGQLKYGSYLQNHNYSANFEKSWMGITATVHLYVACRSLFPDDPVWPDMEYFLHNQDMDKLFVGGLPRTMEEAYSKLLLAVGVPATHFARNSRSTDFKLNMNKGFVAGRLVSNPCILDDVFTLWMCGGEHRNNDIVFNLVRAIMDPKNIARKSQQADEPGLEALFLDRGLRMTTILDTLAFYIVTESSDFYFDWLSFAETCQRIFDQIIPFCNEMIHCTTPIAAVAALFIEARNSQWVAEEIGKGIDAQKCVRETATGMIKVREIIQNLARKGMKVNFGADKKFEDAKAWVGDKEMFGVMSKSLGSNYPRMSPSLQAQVYKNWPEEDVARSAVLRMNSPPIRRAVCECCQ